MICVVLYIMKRLKLLVFFPVVILSLITFLMVCCLFLPQANRLWNCQQKHNKHQKAWLSKVVTHSAEPFSLYYAFKSSRTGVKMDCFSRTVDALRLWACVLQRDIMQALCGKDYSVCTALWVWLCPTLPTGLVMWNPVSCLIATWNIEVLSEGTEPWHCKLLFFSSLSYNA